MRTSDGNCEVCTEYGGRTFQPINLGGHVATLAVCAHCGDVDMVESEVEGTDDCPSS